MLNFQILFKIQKNSANFTFIGGPGPCPPPGPLVSAPWGGGGMSRCLHAQDLIIVAAAHTRVWILFSSIFPRETISIRSIFPY